MIFHDEPGQTPIDAAEADALIPPLSTQEELNAWEEMNIRSADIWALSPRAMKRAEPFSEDCLFDLHRRMFDQTWRWAGKLRDRDKNIGVPFFKIRVELRQLLDDARYWRDNETYEFDEMVMRFHHRLVQIHLFPNGNGRHARLVADVISRKAGNPRYSWGGKSLVGAGSARSDYLNALRSADNGDHSPLVAFCRS